MSAAGLVIAFAIVLLGLALAGPVLLRSGAPALVRFPHLAVVLIPGSVIVWLIGLLSIGPMLAWISSGPALLPGRAAEACQRCIAAANPFGADPPTTIIPTVLLFLIPAAAAAVLIIGMAHQLSLRSGQMRRTARILLAGGEPARIAGYDVTIIPDDRVLASSLPASQGGIVLSRGARDVLAEHELDAVLAHEHAHTSRRHHLIRAVMDSLVSLLGRVPLVAESGKTLPAYLEIAADKHAQKAAGTPAVVSALVTLGERQQRDVGLLHMAGPERVRHLVAPVGGAAGALPATAMMLTMVVLLGFTAMVMAPYGNAVIAGCL